jgi:hypothetical protein
MATLPMRSAAELSRSSEKLINTVISGEIRVSHALGIANLMEHRRRIIETDDREKRLRAVEQRAEGIEPPRTDPTSNCQPS